jgi:hypothetical protein
MVNGTEVDSSYRKLELHGLRQWKSFSFLHLSCILWCGAVRYRTYLNHITIQKITQSKTNKRQYSNA